MVLLNEWRYMLRQPISWLAVILICSFASILSVGLSVDGEDPNKRLLLSQISLLMLVFPILLAALAPMIMLRDRTRHMHELIEATALPAIVRWQARWLALVTLVAVLTTMALLIVLLLHISHFGLSTMVLTNSAMLLIFAVLPTLFLYASLALFLNLKTRLQLVVPAVFIAIWLSYLVLASLAGSPVLAGSSVLNEQFYLFMLWADPTGFTALMDKLQTGEAFFSAQFMFNRLVYLVLGLLSLWFLLSRTSSEFRGLSAHHPQGEKTKKQVVLYRYSRLSGSDLAKFISLWHNGRRAILSERVTQVALLLLPLFIFSEVISGLDYVEPYARLVTDHPVTSLAINSMDALNRIAFDTLPVLATFLLAFWSWMITQGDEQNQFSEIISSCAIKNSQLLGAQLLVITLMVWIVILLTAFGTSAAEWLAGSNWQLGSYIKILGLQSLPLMFIGYLFVCIFHLSRHRLVAITIITVIILVKFSPITTNLGLTHTLWMIASSPLQEPDQYWGFARSLSVFLPYMAFWTIFTISVIALALVRSNRGTVFSGQGWFRLPVACYLLLLLTVATGYQLHLGLIAERPLMSSDLREAWKANYEKQFSHWQGLAQPSITQIDAYVDIYPQQGKADFTLRYRLSNNTKQAIDSLLVGRYGNQGFTEIIIEDAEIEQIDQKLQQRVYRLNRPLAPGQSVTMTSKFTYSEPLLWPASFQQVVKPAFTYLRSVPLLPKVGYQLEFQLQDNHLRQSYGLAPLNLPPPSQTFADNDSGTEQYDWVTVNTTVSTSQGQQGIAQGKLLKQWQHEDRAYFSYATTTPIRNILAWLSLPQNGIDNQQKTKYKNVSLGVFAASAALTSDVHMQAMQDTLQWFDHYLVPYRGEQLTLLATPDFGATGYALPQMILIGYKEGFRAKPTAGALFDQRYRRTVHETAHQWFGHDIGNGVLLDSAFLVESMAKYVELVILELHQGKAAMQALVDYEKTRFIEAQRNNLQPIVSLVDATDNHDMYSRATLAFAILRTRLGDELIIGALSQLWQQHGYPKKPARSMDFVRLLKQQAERRFEGNEQARMINVIDKALLSTDIEWLSDSVDKLANELLH
jgi:ABC-2 type transport system permease protein